MTEMRWRTTLAVRGGLLPRSPVNGYGGTPGKRLRFTVRAKEQDDSLMEISVERPAYEGVAASIDLMCTTPDAKCDEALASVATQERLRVVLEDKLALSERASSRQRGDLGSRGVQTGCGRGRSCALRCRQARSLVG